MTVRLRAHHLLCMLTYVGRGYSAAFTENFDRICERLGRGEEIELVEGPDDVCAPLLCTADPHCHEASVVARDRLAADAAALQLKRPVTTGSRLVLDADLLGRLRTAFRSGASRAACRSCEWHDLCTDVAAGGYREIKLRAG
ncbi:hypothetical protein A8950_1411 [Dongia mobilis]|uniref:DUF1284 domain-containing protein n=1 Tax=Dongia mobilis TaxID=578943 RepID=A0A4R6WV14_9PROT|nr:DUF1284 domain-containing protein [Dongia mobilis]TDQ83126.1 hypothetical protein A8950_1411 [Dongia mobilis]